jgi:hypothetical protein
MPDIRAAAGEYDLALPLISFDFAGYFQYAGEVRTNPRRLAGNTAKNLLYFFLG